MWPPGAPRGDCAPFFLAPSLQRFCPVTPYISLLSWAFLVGARPLLDGGLPWGLCSPPEGLLASVFTCWPDICKLFIHVLAPRPAVLSLGNLNAAGMGMCCASSPLGFVICQPWALRQVMEPS